jgi:transcription elongation factor GreA-like protein/transcription elongation GreA/GreB family factor
LLIFLQGKEFPAILIWKVIRKDLMEYFKQFQNHILNNDLPSLISLWQEYCLSDEIDADELKQTLLVAKQSPLASSFGRYVTDILPLWKNLKESDLKDDCIKLIFDIQTINDLNLANFAYTYLEERYKGDPSFLQKIKLVGLREKKAFPSAIANFELLAHMKVGNFFLHSGGWGIGEVIDVSMLREQITLEFDNVSGNKEISFANAFKTLIPVSKDHFLARRFGDADNFETYARANPVEVIRMLLKDLGPKTAQEIKDELEGVVIPEADWAKWWQLTRTKLKKDTFIESPENLKDNFALRKSEVTHEDRLLKELAAKKSTANLIELIYSFLRDFPQSIKNESFKTVLKTSLSDVLAQKEVTDTEELQILFMLQDLGHEKASELSNLLPKYAHPEKIVNEITVLAHKKRFLIEMKKVRDDWQTLFASVLLSIEQNPLRDYILEELMKNKHENLVKEKITQLLDNPMLSPNAFLWYFQKILSPDMDYPYANQQGHNAFLESFFVLLHKIETSPPHKDLIKKMHTFLTSGRYANVRRIFEHSDIETIKEVLLLCTKCMTLSDHDIKILHSLAEVVHPSLGNLRKEGSLEEDEDEIIWTTKEGYIKIKERIEQIATVDTVENAKEIEVARAHGDLRENSEFKFAQERRSRLQSELRFLSDQFKHMRILTKEDIKTDAVNVGTIVELESATGARQTYTLLGPWDTDPEKNILSFQSKIAKDLIGLPIGNKCKIQDQEWKISSIRSFLS